MTDAQASDDASSPEDPGASGQEPLLFDVPVECQLRDAEQLLDQLVDAGDAAPIVIKADEVETMNSALVLVLASAATSRAEGAPKIAIERPSEAFTDAFKDLGMFKHLMSMEFRT